MSLSALVSPGHPMRTSSSHLIFAFNAQYKKNKNNITNNNTTNNNSSIITKNSYMLKCLVIRRIIFTIIIIIIIFRHQLKTHFSTFIPSPVFWPFDWHRYSGPCSNVCYLDHSMFPYLLLTTNTTDLLVDAAARRALELTRDLSSCSVSRELISLYRSSDTSPAMLSIVAGLPPGRRWSGNSSLVTSSDSYPLQHSVGDPL